jgi:hypothetical protein
MKAIQYLTLLSTLALGAPLMAADDYLHFPGKGKKVVLIAGDDEYRSEEGLPMLGKILSQRHGFDCTVLFPAEADGVIKPAEHVALSNPDALDEAEAIVMLLRFRNWATEDLKKFEDAYLRGVPIIALRTSTHAFNIEGDSPYKKWTWTSGEEGWKGGFGKQVLGETWVAHHGGHKSEGCRGVIVDANKGHDILKGVSDVFADSDVYTASPPEDATILMLGQVTDSLKPDSKPVAGKKNDPMQPVVWTREYKNEAGKVNRIMTTTMGAATDLLSEDLRRLVVNSVFWGLKMPVPDKADVTLVYPYLPSMFGFGSERKNFKASDMALGKALLAP